MKPWAALLAPLLALSPAGCEPVESVPAPGLSESTLAPGFTLEKLAGGELALSALRGHPVVIDFWATWCGPCEQTIPVIKAFHETYGDRVSVLGISVDWDRDAIAPFVLDHGMTYPILLGDEGLAMRFGAPGFPSLFVIDAEGRIRESHVGVITLPELEAAVAPLLDAAPRRAPEPPAASSGALAAPKSPE
jgi:thiol-disulfide isomerase/thioredoxin